MRRAALAAALVLAGCGGGGGKHLPKDVYQRRGDAVCTRYTAAIHKLGTPTKFSEIGPFITQALPILQRTVRDLGRLAPPAELESQFNDFMDAARATVARADALRAAAANADANEVQQLLKQAASASGRRAALANKAALPACALS